MTTESAAAQRELHRLVPGREGPQPAGAGRSTPVLARGDGARVLDVDGNWYVEYGMDLSAVTLGHGYFPVVRAVTEAAIAGTSFTSSNVWELEAAQQLVDQVPGADMVRFTTHCSDAGAAAARLARASTGRDLVAVCAADRPVFSTGGLVGTTVLDQGIADLAEDRTVTFRYGDLNSVHAILENYRGRIAAFFLAAATATSEPPPGFLVGLRDLADTHGVVLIFDESLTGMRWSVGGAQEVYEVLPDLSIWGRSLGNGFPIAALAGRRALMELGGTSVDRRTALLATTPDAEATGLAAYLAVADAYARRDAVETMERQGRLLAEGVRAVVASHQLSDHVTLTGRPSCLVFETRDAHGTLSEELRSLFVREMLRRGVLAQSFVLSAAHTDEDIAVTIEAVEGALDAFTAALESGAVAGRSEGRPATAADGEHVDAVPPPPPGQNDPA